VAGGGIENPRLLLASRHGAGYGNDGDVVGRYHMDHFRTISGVLTPADPHVFERAGLYDVRRTGDRVRMGKIVPTDALMEANSLVNSAAMVLPKLPPGLVGDVKALRNVVRPGGAGIRDRLAALRTGAVATASVGRTALEMAVRQRRVPPRTDAGWSQLLGNAGRYRTFEIEHQVEQVPNRDNRILLGSGLDRFGRRVAELRLRWSPADLRSLRRTQKLFADAVASSGLGEFAIEPWDEWPALTTPAGAAHPMGGTRMHDDRRRGVVDAGGRVHGVRNLFVAGSSVFPTGGYSNPTFTVLALAIRLADRLAAEAASLPIGTD
jgi:choline dehydrogenase-like flavoprotein